MTAPATTPSPVTTLTGPAPGWFTPGDCRLEDFRPLVEQATRPGDYPHADGVQHNILIYGERMRGYPVQAHLLSPALTLQGAVAHCDMPVESGPTMYLPHSQKYPPGYIAYQLPEFIEYFGAHYVQLPLERGDAAFFSPALFHGAGTRIVGAA